MDRKLIAWARAVKARRRHAATRLPVVKAQTGPRLPVLWLFTDLDRLPDPRPAVAALPPGLCGVVLRHDALPRAERAQLGRDLARLCRARRLALSVAGDARLAAALGAGLHLRAGRTRRQRRGLWTTSSAHGLAEVLRAHHTGASAIFLSPCFPTSSHSGARSLGPVRWSLIASGAHLKLFALGGIDGQRVRSLPPSCAGAGAIGALASVAC